MYNLSSETSGHYVVEDLNRTINVPSELISPYYAGGSQFIQEFRLSYYDSKLNDVTSTTFYVGLSTPYTYSLDSKLWFQTMEEMVSWMNQEKDEHPIVLSPLKSRLSLKMLSGDMLEIDIDYGNVDFSPYQQINIFLREIGLGGASSMRLKSCEDLIDIDVLRPFHYSIFDEKGVKNLETDVIHDGQEMNIFIH